MHKNNTKSDHLMSDLKYFSNLLYVLQQFGLQIQIPSVVFRVWNPESVVLKDLGGFQFNLLNVVIYKQTVTSLTSRKHPI